MNRSIDLNLVETYSCGREGMIVGLCENLGIPRVFDKELTSVIGRTPEIPYGVLGMMMIVNMCDDHHPLNSMREYFEDKDLEGIFHHPVHLDQINDDRLGRLLDALYEAGPRQIYSKIAVNALKNYGIKVNSLNFDTTSKVMWGLYDSPNGKVGAISIDFGHSKDHRSDKRQIKFGLGCANGLPIDAEVLSGNLDDKTYNNEVLKRIDQMLSQFDVTRDGFYYIADSALFSKENFDIAKDKEIHMITRMPDNVTLCKRLMGRALDSFDELESITLKGSKESNRNYRVLETTDSYHGHTLKMACYYSENLRSKKTETLEKMVAKEREALKKLAAKLSKRAFACQEDTEREMAKLSDQELKKIAFHTVDFEIQEKVKRRRGRPSQDASKNVKSIEYQLNLTSEEDPAAKEEWLRKSCMFVLCSNDTHISSYDLIHEYKTQDEVEKKFTALKSTEFVSSIFLNSPHRIEAFGYLMLLAILVLSTAEYVIRRELHLFGTYLIGSERRKITRPTIKTILRMVKPVKIRVIKHRDRPWERHIAKDPNDTVMKILDYLLIPLENFTRGSN